MQHLRIEPAQRHHIPLILEFINALAEHVNLAEQVTATEQELARTLLGQHPCAETLIAYCSDAPAAFAVFYQSYSTFAAKPAIYIEDVYVKPQFRRKGIARALFAHIANLALRRDCCKIEWDAKDSNKPALSLYKKLGAQHLKNRLVYRIEGQSLKALAKK